MTTPTTAATIPAANAIDAFFANLKSDLQVVEADVISVIQNIGAGLEVAAQDIEWGLSWLGSHLGQVAQTMTAVTTTVTALKTAGVPIPDELTSGIEQMQQAAAGVTAALSNEAIAANAGTALTDGYNATKALQVAAATAASISATIAAATAPAPGGNAPTP